jgi:hypothetical protein
MFGLMVIASGAQAEIYKCVDDQGHVTYSNSRLSSRGCGVLSGDQPVSSVPSSRPSAKPAASPSPSFPRVSEEAQRSRDTDRKKILAQELAGEEQALADARKALADQEAVRLGGEKNYQKVLDRLQPFKDKVELHQRNVEALKREISSIK